MDLGTDIYNKTLPSGNNNRRVKMALVKKTVVDKVEVVGEHKMVQCRSYLGRR